MALRGDFGSRVLAAHPHLPVHCIHIRGIYRRVLSVVLLALDVGFDFLFARDVSWSGPFILDSWKRNKIGS